MANETIHFPPGDSSVYLKWADDGSTQDGICGVGYETSGTPGQFLGALRFDNVAIPKNSSISSAGINIKVDQRTGSGDIAVKIWGVDEDNSGTGDPFGRTKTTAFNTHSMDPTAGGYYGIDVGSIVEEIVSRSGWVSGNAIHFIFEFNGTPPASSNYIFDFNGSVKSYFNYRIAAEPNFKPTPKSVSAPSFPTAKDVGMKFSNPGVSVFDATDDQTYLTTRKRQFKIFAESYYQSVSGDVSAGFKAIAHNLGYVPFVSVYVKSSVFGGEWKRLPVNWAFEDYPAYGVDNTYLYLHSAIAGEEFYYRIFLDRIV